MLKLLKKFHPVIPADELVYNKFKTHTMVPKEWYLTNLKIAQSIIGLPGSIVECGVWRGGMMAGIATILGPERDYYLFDSFEGLPQAEDIDGPAAKAWQEDKHGPSYYDNCKAEQFHAEEAMKIAGVRNATFERGWFSETLPNYHIDSPIALLRLDGDWYESTTTCLDNLFHQVVSGGVVVIDDYYTWDGCSRAVHDFLSRKKLPDRIESKNGVCFIRKI